MNETIHIDFARADWDENIAPFLPSELRDEINRGLGRLEGRRATNFGPSPRIKIDKIEIALTDRPF